jgi:hypothetical protein
MHAAEQTDEEYGKESAVRHHLISESRRSWYGAGMNQMTFE